MSILNCYLLFALLLAMRAFVVLGWRGVVTSIIKCFVDMPMIVLGWFVVPVALLFRTADDHLPKWAWPWDNAAHGTDGDNFWIKRCGDTFWCRYQWLAFRNPTYNLGRHVFSIKNKAGYLKHGDMVVGDKKQPGEYFIECDVYWEYYHIGTPYQLLSSAEWLSWWPALQGWLTKRRALRERYGWKIDGSEPGEVCGFVCVFNPLMPYSGV